MKNKDIFKASAITAIYVVLCLILEPISFGVIQFRISEILCLLSVEFPYAIFANTLGCFISNLMLGGLGIVDTVFGSLATFLACLFAYMLRHIKHKNLPIVSGLAIVLVNGLIIGIELGFITNNIAMIPLAIIEITASEFIVIMVIGLPIFNKLIEVLKDNH